MTRNLRMLGVALAAVLALSAVGASMASAQTNFTTSVVPNTLTGVQGATKDKLSTTAGSVECSTVTYHGEVKASPTSTVEVAPTFSGCTWGIATIIHTNSCKYLFHIDPTNVNVTTGTTDIVCPAGKEITMTAGTGTVKCTLHIPAQTGLGTVTFSPGTGADVGKVHVAVSISGKIKYSHTEGTGLAKCPSGSGTSGSYVGTALVEGDAAQIFVD